MRKPACPPRRPPGPCESVLVQKIIACEQRTIPCLCTELDITGLPECAPEPLRIVRVQASGSQPWWTPLSDCHCGQIPVRITIPVTVWLCDSCGGTHTASALLDVETTLPRSLCLAEGARHSLFILPCVQLLGCECGFTVRLRITLECYLLCCEPCQLHRPAPSCPELPLYPPPIRPHCW